MIDDQSPLYRLVLWLGWLRSRCDFSSHQMGRHPYGSMPFKSMFEGYVT